MGPLILPIVILSTSCQRSEAVFDLGDLPTAECGVSIKRSISSISIHYLEAHKTYLVNGLIVEEDQVADVIATEARKTPFLRPILHFYFPKDYPVSTFHKISSTFQSNSGDQGIFYLSTMLPTTPNQNTKEKSAHDRTEYATHVYGFPLGALISDLENLDTTKENGFGILDIQTNKFIWNQKSIRSLSHLQDEIGIFYEASSLIDALPILQITIEEEVSIQRMINALDGSCFHDRKIQILPKLEK